MSPTTACYLVSDAFKTETQALAHRLHLPLLHEEHHADFFLYFTPDGLWLKQKDDRTAKTIQVNFETGRTHYRAHNGGGRNQAIAKVIGLKQYKNPLILDGTAGLGRDAFILASLGCHVILIEKSPILFALLEDGIKRAKLNPQLTEIISRMELIQGNSINHMQQIDQKPDVIYLDPMFPKRKKSALVKKEMQLLKSLLGQETQAAELFHAAHQAAPKRIVIKRPRLADFIVPQKPTFSLNGQSARFDVYCLT